MKNIIYILFLCLLASCSSDYLEVESTNEITQETMFKTTENAQKAINGLAKLMYMPYTYTTPTSASASYDGEGAVMLSNGNYMGNHTVVANKNAFGVLYMGGTYMSNVVSVYDYYPWSYYYKLISNANAIIKNIDGADGSQNEIDFIKAQALTFRAHAYFKLSQIYCKRWLDDPLGSSRGLVLRLGDTQGNQTACTLNKLYTQLYSDLNNAIKLYEGSSQSRSQDDYWTPDISVARAVFARAALTKGDYAQADSMARDAREGYTLMTNAEYKSGFNASNSEWIWGGYSSSSQSAGQYSMLAQMAYNSKFFLDKPTLISRELYVKIPETDIRRDLFLNPGDFAYKTTGNTLGLAEKASYPDLYNKAFDLYPDLKGKVYAYMQFKFKTADDAGAGQGCLPFIRASEMYLIEAEANYHLREEAKACALLTTLIKDSGRDPSYVANKTGDALMEEIKFYRAVELWGEGFDWFDMKRWGDKIDRKGYADGGNFYGRLVFSTTPEMYEGWCWVYPALETDYNELVTAFDTAE